MEHPLFVPSQIWVAPFAALLVGIAVIPLVAPAFWESNVRKLGVSLLLGLPVLGLYLVEHPASLTHTARDRAAFARGALEAARWVRGRRGWFSMRDVLGL